MKLRAKILILLLGVIIPVMLFFGIVGTFFFDEALKKESIKSHKLMYSLYMPAISIYLWEFDIERVKESILKIMNNNYASEVLLYDLDGSLIFGAKKNFLKNNIDLLSKINDSNSSISKYEINKYIENDKDKNKDSINLIQIENKNGNTSEMGILYHKNLKPLKYEPIGFIVFNFSHLELRSIIKKSILSIFIIMSIITSILTSLLLILIQKNLINPIVFLNRASLVIALGRKRLIKEKNGKDELSELIRNFNMMSHQIFQNQLNLKFIGEEGIKISSCITIDSLVKQLIQSIKKVTEEFIQFDFYISSELLGENKLNGYILVQLENEHVNYGVKNEIKFGDEENFSENTKRICIQNTGYGKISAIIDFYSSKENNQIIYLKKVEGIFRTVQALQVSAISAIATMNVIHEQKEQVRLLREQETARLVQMDLLPSGALKTFLNYEIVGYFEPATECAGDWWNFYELSQDRILILLGDVTGHGLGSALLAAVVKGYSDSFVHKNEITTAEILSQLDDVVFQIGKGNRVMTMFAAIFDPNLKTIEISNASHNFPFVINKQGVQKLVANGSPLGFQTNIFSEKKSKYNSKIYQFEQNDLIVIYSDGLIESLNDEGLNFSDKRLKQILISKQNVNVEEIKNEILVEFKKFITSPHLVDDMTFVICKFK